jgi:hypothetical protein
VHSRISALLDVIVTPAGRQVGTLVDAFFIKQGENLERD